MRRVLTLGLAWPGTWLADEASSLAASLLLAAAATVATATVLLPYIAHSTTFPHTPSSVALTDHVVRWPAAPGPHTRRAAAAATDVLACLLLCQRRSDLGTSQITRYAPRVFFPKPGQQAGRGVVEGGGRGDGGEGKGAKAYLDDLACSSAPALLPSACVYFLVRDLDYYNFFLPPLFLPTAAILACLINNKMLGFVDLRGG